MKECCKFWKENTVFNYCCECGARLNLNAKDILFELNLQWQPRIAVDFDSCLCMSHYPECGEPNLALIKLAKDFKELGCTLYLNTCRHNESLDKALKWCSQLGLEFDFVNENDPKMIDMFGESRKLGVDIYIDDKAMKIYC
ncbi:MAG: hypothetical protein ACRCTZ_17020 [Sarcina sp.]